MASGLGTLTVWLKAPTQGLKSDLGDAKGAIVAFSRTSDAAISAFASEASAKLLGLRDSAVDVAFNIKALQQAGAGTFGKLAAGAGAVGVAIAGWEIGKKIAEFAGLESKFADFFFGAGNKKFESDILDKKIQGLPARGTMLAEEAAAKKARDEDISAQVKEMPRLLEQIDDIQRRNDERRMTNQELLNSLIKTQESNTLQFQNLSYIKNPQAYLEAKKKELELAGRISEVESKVQEEKRKAEEEGIDNMFDFFRQNEKKPEPMRTQSSIVSAVQKGSAEALRIENTKTSKSDPIAEDTKSIEQSVRGILKMMQKIEGGANPLEVLAAL